MGYQQSASPSQIPLRSIIITDQLFSRPERKPDEGAVNRALVVLAQTMANSPETILQRLVETALTLCDAHSSGLSLLEEENGKEIFRWHGVAGEYAGHLWGTTPREFSPCGTVLDTDRVQLMSKLDSHFEYFSKVQPRIEEALLVPFHVDGKAVGTIWVISHDEGRRFDAKDADVMQTLGEFAAAAYRVVQSQEQLGQANRDLATRNEELQQSQVSLRAANAELQQFVLSASHDLQEPLRTITAFTELLQRQSREDADPGTQHLLSFVIDGAKRMKNLLDDLLAYSGIGRDAEEFETMSLQDALDGALANLRVIIEEQDATITHDALPSFRASKSQMTLLLQNLILNSIKYRRKQEPPRISISAQRNGNDEWVVSVADNGEGFSEEDSKTIFGVFRRLHGSDIPGTGMGLALCQKIMQRHRGTITAASVPGQGSTFFFTIPA